MKKLDVNKLKQWYKFGLWTEEMVLDAVKKGAITQEEADEILKK